MRLPRIPVWLSFDQVKKKVIFIVMRSTSSLTPGRWWGARVLRMARMVVIKVGMRTNLT